MHGCDKNKAADDCNEKSSGVMFLMVAGVRLRGCTSVYCELAFYRLK